LSKGSRGFWTTFLLAAMLFLGVGLSACVTVPRDPQADNVLVSFVFVGRHDSVCLSGDFNGWSSESNCLERKGDQWSVQLVLPPGTYRYGFVIDRREWVCDPEALIQEDDGFGKKNSVLVIDPAVTKRHSEP
jgi:Glycogen recognition site of AMP-activated protein kinase